jgi:hypothetical protein
MFLAGSDSEAEDDYVGDAVGAAEGPSSSVLNSSDAAAIAMHCGLRRVDACREPPWLAALLARRAEAEAGGEGDGEGEGEGEGAAVERSAAAASPAAASSRAAMAQRPRRRRNSLSDALRVLLPGERAAVDELGEEEQGGQEEAAGPDVVLQRVLAEAGFGKEPSEADTVQVGGDRVPRLLVALGEALRAAGGIDEPRIFAQTPPAEELLEAVRQLNLAPVPSPPRRNLSTAEPSAQTARPHAIAALVKEWLAQLPGEGGLISLSQAELASVYAAKEPLLPTRALLDGMRGSLRGEAWRWLARFLAEVEQASPRNKMPARELAIVLAPLLSPEPRPEPSADRAAEPPPAAATNAAACERTMHVMRFVQHSVAVMARKQLSLVRSPLAPHRRPNARPQPSQPS